MEDNATDAGKQVMIRMEARDLDRLRELADRKRTSLSAVIREIVAAELDRRDAPDA